MASKPTSRRIALFDKWHEKVDFYGKPVEFTFKGQDRYTSRVGGALSLMTILIMMVLSVEKFIELRSQIDALLTMQERGVLGG